MSKRPDMIQGTLDLLILKLLSLEPMHGFGLTEAIEQRSGDVLRVNQGSLYPALHRLTINGWIESKWMTTENNRRARFYRLTRTGRTQLAREARHWRNLSGAVEQILQAI
jgi:transcriptional regulator